MGNDKMAFKITKDDLKKSQRCPPGTHVATLVEVEEPYISENSGCTVQKCVFETDKGHQVPVWFNDAVTANLIEFVEAADNVKMNMDNIDSMPEIELKDYKGKRVAIAVSHNKDGKGKIQANIDNFFSADKVPF